MDAAAAATAECSFIGDAQQFPVAKLFEGGHHITSKVRLGLEMTAIRRRREGRSCGTGLWGKYWRPTVAGRYLQPCALADTPNAQAKSFAAIGVKRCFIQLAVGRA